MTHDLVQRARVYVREDDRSATQPLFVAILEHLRREGASGATVLRGVTGFGPARRVVAATVAPGDSAPLIIEWVDPADRIQRVLPEIQELAPRALITVEPIEIYHALLRTQGALAGGVEVARCMRGEPYVLHADALVGEALIVMLAYDQPVVPIVNDQNVLQGIVTPDDLARAGVALPYRVLRSLTHDESKQYLSVVANKPIRAIFNSEPRSTTASAPLIETLRKMIEWDYEAMPVTNRDGHVVGLVYADDVLQQVLATPDSTPGVEAADGETRVRVLMQTMVPQAAATSALVDALPTLLRTAPPYLIALDSRGTVTGTVSDTQLLATVPAAARPLILDMLITRSVPQHNDALRGLTVADVAQPHGTLLTTDNTLQEAVQSMLAEAQEYLPVVNQADALVGLVRRSGLLRAILQESS